MKPLASAQTVLEYFKAIFRLIAGLAWPVLIGFVVFFSKGNPRTGSSLG
jgi:hypothetical protein